MKCEIMSRWSGKVLFSIDTVNLKSAIEAAAIKGVDLQNADLQNADLGNADLRNARLREACLQGASLQGSDLQGADFRNAYLQDANLRNSYLQGAYFQEAYLQGADLRGAYLQDAYLRGADLRGANLRGADLRGADLQGANLRGVEGVSPYLFTTLLMLLDQPGKIRAYKLVTEKGEEPYDEGVKYLLDETFEAENFDENTDNQYGAGINLASLDWCMKNWKPGHRILIMEFEAEDIAAIPTATDGKFRVKRCQRVGEKSLEEIGLLEEKDNSSRPFTYKL